MAAIHAPYNTVKKSGSKTVGQIREFLHSKQVASLSFVEDVKENSERVIHQLSLDSRHVSFDDGFIALQGERHHGLDFLAVVLQKQPGLVISDRALNPSEQAILDAHNTDKAHNHDTHCTVWILEELSEKSSGLLAAIAHWFYNQPSQRIKVIGITGTNGKTSTAFYTAQLLAGLNQTVALIGTLGNGLLGALRGTQNTTPDVVTVHRLLAEFIALGADCVVMEVSSHALTLGRIDQVEFEVVALTQVTRDHLDFHGTVAHYQAAKQILFTDIKSHHQVLNLNDPIGQQLAASGRLTSMFGYAMSDVGSEGHSTKHSITHKNHEIHNLDSLAKLQCTQLSLLPNGLQLTLRVQGSLSETVSGSLSAPLLESVLDVDVEVEVEVSLLGRFNVENVLCACSIVLLVLEAKDAENPSKHTDSSIDLDCFQSLQPLLAELESVEGRMQRVHPSPTVIVDFAHTADALEQVLLAVKQHLTGEGKQSDANLQLNVSALKKPVKFTGTTRPGGFKEFDSHEYPERTGRLWLVFGCGGDRDQGKRPLMAEVAERIADKVMLTDDNPRFENPQQIRAQILRGFKQPERVLQQADRQLAIEQVLMNAQPEDIVVIAGKGHERYQDIQGVKTDFCDQQIVQAWFASQSANTESEEERNLLADLSPELLLEVLQKQIGLSNTSLGSSNFLQGEQAMTEKLSSEKIGDCEAPFEWQLTDLRESVDGEFIGVLGESESIRFSSISTDTRTLKAGALYIALKGENFDGHHFIKQAIQQGAAAILLSELSSSDPLIVPGVLVPDTRVAYGQFAKWHRLQMPLKKLIAITGSNGKTTTKTLLLNLFQQVGQTLATEGNLNNDYGVPQTLLKLRPEDRYAIIEMGANHPQEIAYLTHLAQPDIALINNASGAHLEGFGSLQGVIETKGEIFQGLNQQSAELSETGVAVLNCDSPGYQAWLKICAELKVEKVVSFGACPQAEVRILPATNSKENLKASRSNGVENTEVNSVQKSDQMSAQLSSNGIRFDLCLTASISPKGLAEQKTIEMPVLGQHNAHNAAACVAVALSAGLSWSQIQPGLVSFSGVPGRLQSQKIRTGWLIDDSYNANPASVKAAIDALTTLPGLAILCLGAMGELGGSEASAHQEIARYAQQKGVDVLLTYGTATQPMATDFGAQAHYFEEHAQLLDALLTLLQQQEESSQNANVLVKGSRSTRMERISQAVVAELSV